MRSVFFPDPNDSCWVTFGSNYPESCVYCDDVALQVWDPMAGWDPAPTIIGDKVNDDDGNGSIRWAANGAYALHVWMDHSRGQVRSTEFLHSTGSRDLEFVRPA